jgi:hypothetical protein
VLFSGLESDSVQTTQFLKRYNFSITAPVSAVIGDCEQTALAPDPARESHAEKFPSAFLPEVPQTHAVYTGQNRRP